MRCLWVRKHMAQIVLIILDVVYIHLTLDKIMALINLATSILWLRISTISSLWAETMALCTERACPWCQDQLFAELGRSRRHGKLRPLITYGVVDDRQICWRLVKGWVTLVSWSRLSKVRVKFIICQREHVSTRKPIVDFWNYSSMSTTFVSQSISRFRRALPDQWT